MLILKLENLKSVSNKTYEKISELCNDLDFLGSFNSVDIEGDSYYREHYLKVLKNVESYVNRLEEKDESDLIEFEPQSLDKMVILSQTSPYWYEDGFTTFELTTKDNKTQALMLYREVLKSKTSTHYYDCEYPQNDPAYILKFIYKDKSVDVIQSSENLS